MKKQVITVAMLMFSMSSSFAGSFGIKEDSVKMNHKIKVTESEKPSVYNLFYAAQNKGYVHVNIYTPSGSKIHSSLCKSEDALNLKQSYNLENLPFGIYKFEVINNGVKTIEMLDYHDKMVKMDVTVAPTNEKGKYNLNVKRDILKPVLINIYDEHNFVLYQDIIEIGTNFSRVYDLRQTTAKEVSFEVTCGGTKYLKKIQ